MWVHSESRTWHDNNIQSNASYRSVLTTQSNNLNSLAKWLSIRLRTKWFESRCCYLNFRYGACFEQGVPWHSVPYIDMNTDLKKPAENDFEKAFLKLINNSVFEKIMKNFRKYRDIRIITPTNEETIWCQRQTIKLESFSQQLYLP